MIEIRNLSHSFGDKILYKNVNININDHDKIGLVGLNGTGKTTFINILNGSIICDQGAIIIPQNIKVGYLDQFVKVEQEQSVQQYLESAFQDLFEVEKQYNEVVEWLSIELDNQDFLLKKLNALFEILINKDFYDIPTKINQIATGLGIVSFGLNNSMSSLSGGQKMKVMLAKILLQNPDFLILDEPTNYLDSNHIEWFVGYLKKFKGSLLLVSHDTTFLDRVVEIIWALEKESIIRYNGNYTAYLKQKAINIEVEEKHRISVEREAKKLKEYIDKNKARTATAKQAQSREKKLEKLEITQQEKELPEPTFNFKHINSNFNLLINIKNLSVGYEKPLLKNIFLSVQKDEKIRLSGFNGVGKTTILKTICNKIPALDGTINFMGKVKIGYYEQELHFEDLNLTPLQELSNTYPHCTEKELRQALAKVGITAKHIAEPLRLLSGGEQCRVQLCKLTFEPYHCLILDEPTNHLDIKAKKALVKAINNFSGAVIFVSHEQDFADMIINHQEIDMKIYR